MIACDTKTHTDSLSLKQLFLYPKLGTYMVCFLYKFKNCQFTLCDCTSLTCVFIWYAESTSLALVMLNGPTRPLFHLFSSFQIHITNFTTIRYVKKCPSSIWCQDSNSWPLEYESPPMTARPVVPPFHFVMLYKFKMLIQMSCLCKCSWLVYSITKYCWYTSLNILKCLTYETFVPRRSWCGTINVVARKGCHFETGKWTFKRTWTF